MSHYSADKILEFLSPLYNKRLALCFKIGKLFRKTKFRIEWFTFINQNYE